MNEVISWQTVIIAFFTALPPTIAAIAALIQAIKCKKLVNGRMTELIQLARREAAAIATMSEKAKQAINSQRRKGDNDAIPQDSNR